MLDRLESDYDCSRAGGDLEKLTRELERLQNGETVVDSVNGSEERNRIENQIHFIRNKCGIH